MTLNFKSFFTKYWLETAIGIGFAIISIFLNLQFLDGSNINSKIAGHDEYIAVKEVYSILHPISIKHFIMSVICGNVLFYGRIMFYLDALLAFVPFKIWGVGGLVLTIRLVHAFLILISAYILANTFLKDKLSKLVFYLSAFGLYYTLYFIMMPKPEPWQIFFLAVFLNRFKKSEWKFGAHFLFLGIAYGLKFNILLIMPLLFLLPVLKYGFKPSFMKGIGSFVYFLSGFLLAIPCLVLTPVKPMFLKTYLHETFGGTAKSYDNADTGVLNWMSEYGGAYFGFSYLSYFFIGLALLGLIYAVKHEVKLKSYSSTVLLLSGFILFTAIVVLTKRTWPHYLWTAQLMLVLGLLISIENKYFAQLNSAVFSALILVFSVSLFFFFTRELPLYSHLSTEKEMIQTRNNSLKAIEYIKSRPGAKGYSKVGTDGTMLYPFEDFVKVDLYHPFASKLPEIQSTNFQWYWDFPDKIWNDSNDYIVFNKNHPQKLLLKYPEKEFNVNLYEQFKSHENVDYELDTFFGEIMVYSKK